MSKRKDTGLLLLRLAVGGTLAAHGSQKLLGWFGGGGPRGTARVMGAMGFTPPLPAAVAAGLGEGAGGALLALGLGTPAAGSAAAATMATAASVHAPRGFWEMNGGMETPATLGAAALGIAVAGPGRYSLDHATGHALDRPWTTAAALTVGAAAATAVITRRLRTLAAAERDAPQEPPGDAPAEDGPQRTRHAA